jgi:uncharacterized protein (DUF924 family)
VIAPDEVLALWFGRGPLFFRVAWFRQDTALDTACGRFTDEVTAAIRGDLDGWTETPRGTLALVLLLDQFSRNLFRNSPQAFAGDAKAREIARQAVARQFDLPLHPVERCFIYMPFEHAEDLADQEVSVRLFGTLRGALCDETIDYARRHRDVIHRFGRFPHRNAVLGRANTPEEAAYLAEPGAGF